MDEDSQINDLDILVERIQAIEIHPRDVVVITTRELMDDSELEKIRGFVRSRMERIFPDNQFIILNGADISIFRPSTNESTEQ